MKYLLQLLSLMLVSQTAFPKTDFAKKETLPAFEIYSKKHQAIILYDKEGTSLDSIASHLLAEDIYKVSHYKPKVVTNISEVEGNVIVIGTIASKLVNTFIDKKTIKDGFEKQWESYLYKVIDKPTSKIKKAFIIAGTNPRGTAYGVFDLSEKMGVSPWYWWSDVPVVQQNELVLSQNLFQSKAPSVKFRGIFLNDEDWGLRPWAAKTFEPEVGNIGPKTYAKIFELLLRLKANTIWPAMHEGTTAFFNIPGNAKIAETYQIVVGTSHAEPMLRNNVDEWKEKEMGHFNYVSNRDNVYKYWEDRVKESKNVDAIYTIGMRGVHDSKMEGVKTNKEGAELLKQIIKDQRKLFETHINPDATKVPQAFTVYKEVLDLYEEGLQVPDDVTLVWTDDNYGYIRRLSNEQEQKRSGGGGVYYHASYWGRPHDYLWVESVHPALLREEMMKAYQANCKEIWILNVGDLKAIEYSTQLFLDMGYDANSFEDASNVKKHMSTFYSSIFGKTYGKSIADLKWDYFDLAFERKPEFMGWSQTEPTTKTKQTAYNPFYFGDENQTRINKYQNLENQVGFLKDKLPKDLQDSYFQLVYYPAKAASLMNKKFLYADKANIYGKQGRLNAKEYALKSENAFNEIKSITQEYNQVANGRWNGMMDMSPRNLPVFQMPTIETPLQTESADSVGILVENETDSSIQDSKLPTYSHNSNTSHFIDIFLKKAEVVSWKLQNLPDWVIANKKSGVLNANESNNERIQISIDWNKWNKKQPKSTQFTINYGNKIKSINLNIDVNSIDLPKKSFIAMEDKVVIYAQNYSSIQNKNPYKWEKIDGLGYSKAAMQAYPMATAALQTDNLAKVAPRLEYQINLGNPDAFSNPELILYSVPTLPSTTKQGVRVGVQWNEEPIQIVDFVTQGRSEEWKQNVLSNKAAKKIALKSTNKGTNTLKIYMIDEGVALDYFYLNLNKNNPVPYSLLPETAKE
ncbi:Glycosyl hydrolase family 115 [Flavobacterium fluvii]|uniref:Glycosyl hydrolase family 115 n=1 Tax=Flavobacterium fluvii TaxID=468056 RepID=A0A1M5HDG6_9FLAO|nr:glycosyl hydrolase 115 family protein [Flavobacterium fluvii]SHG14029.1 Glycosyl hydrolase family 115 [Flavobacterium fluvii]